MTTTNPTQITPISAIKPALISNTSSMFSHTDNEEDKNSKFELGNRKSQPFLSWWWCATIIGIIPTVVTNLLLTKNEPVLPRPIFPSVTGMITTHTHLDVPTGTRKSDNPLNPTNNYNRQAIPLSPHQNIQTKETLQDPEDFYFHTVQLETHPYICDVMDIYQQYCATNVICEEDLEEDNNEAYFWLDHNERIETHHLSCALHIPTIMEATKELTPMLEEIRRHFKCTTNTRLSRSQLNFWFGKFVLSKVMAHLSNDKKFIVDGHNLALTAQEVIYYFLNRTGRTLPHRHLLVEYDASDIYTLHDMTSRHCYYLDRNEKAWDLSGPFIKKGHYALGKCLFQFPTAELFTATVSL